MIKKAFYIFLAAICAWPAVTAQQKSGRWTIFPSASDVWTNIIETPEKTYMHNGPSLFSLSDSDNEAFVYNAYNKLTDRSGISIIRYNADGGYLFIGYENGNIDLLYDNGDVVNLAEIKDAVLSSGRNIHDVAFGHGRIFVGADFGLAVYDDKEHRVIESGIYNKAVEHVLVLGDKLLFFIDGVPYASSVTDKHNQLDKLTAFPRMYFTDVERINDDTFAYLHTSKAVYRATPDYDAVKMAVGALNITGVDKLYSLSGDGIYGVEADNIALVDGALNVSRVARPESYKTSDVYFNTLKSVWLPTSQGVVRMDLSTSTPTLLMQPFMPSAINTTEPVKLKWSADGSRLYVGNYYYSFFLSTDSNDPHHTVTRVSCISDNGIESVSPLEIKLPTSSSDFDRVSGEILKRQGITGPYEAVPFGGGPTGLAVDPDDAGTYYVANLSGGVFVIKDGEYAGLLNSSNAPYPKAPYTEDVMGLEIDNDGNLWLACRVDNDGPYWYVLPAAHRRNISTVKKEDWVVMDTPSNFRGTRDIFSVFCRKSPYVFHSSGGWTGGFTVRYTAGTPLVSSDDRMIHFNSVTDQNGNSPNLTFTTCAVEDADGQIWIGTGQGVLIIENPSKVFDADFRVRRPIVARNDGTGFGDYLLTSEQIQGIAVDASNRKWLASESSGVYLVSSDGREIIANYTAENSPLPSNNVFSVTCDPQSNKVYFGTDNGLACFDSDSSPASEDYSEVYAYPNPVRPEYNGWITIAGLMDKSLVKIADAAGNVFFQGRSEGGMISWDGCDASGNRVRSGVYFVFASQNESGSASGAVTKILVIN